jgi:hypothetical protein
MVAIAQSTPASSSVPVSPAVRDRAQGVLDLPRIVLFRYHPGYVRLATAHDSHATDDLIADGIAYVLRLNIRLHPELVGEDYRLRVLACLRRYYQGRYRRFRGLSWRRQTRTHETARGQLIRRRSPHGNDDRWLDNGFPSSRSDPAANAEWRETLEFLGDLPLAKKKAIEGVLAGKPKAEVGRELGMNPRQIDDTLRDAVTLMREGGVL